MSGIRGRIHFDEPAPVRRWCEDCQDFTVSMMIDGQEACERSDSHDEWELVDVVDQWFPNGGDDE